jgi:hypothetical protein
MGRGKGMMFGDRGQRGERASSTPTMGIQGNGQPIVGGNVTAINGTTLTITNKSNVTYTIDASSTIVQKRGSATSTLANITVGDNVLIQGTVNGNSVTASLITDQGTMAPNINAQGDRGGRGPVRSFFGAIGGFFQHLFGF